MSMSFFLGSREDFIILAMMILEIQLSEKGKDKCTECGVFL